MRAQLRGFEAGRRKMAVVAAARHILRIAYYVMRDGTSYDPNRLRPRTMSAVTASPQPVAVATS